jgi:hypothetical protein
MEPRSGGSCLGRAWLKHPFARRGKFIDVEFARQFAAPFAAACRITTANPRVAGNASLCILFFYLVADGTINLPWVKTAGSSCAEAQYHFPSWSMVT